MKIIPEKHILKFKDKGCNNLDICKAMCCKKWDINLAYQEHKSKLYESEAYCSLDRKVCLKPLKSCPQVAYRLKKKDDGSCVYLDKNNRCRIYQKRPIVCRNFTCDNGFKLEPVCSIRQEQDEDVEILSFDAGISLDDKFMLNPYLKLKSFKKEDNGMKLFFTDITSCKDKKIILKGITYFSTKKEAASLLGQFKKPSRLKSVLEKLSIKLSKQDLITLINFLTDEDILIAVF
ncbi:MAG: YkgJ family cysteine cluster protein [Candidatus Omnitrophica bacterium]|nr:YkgJ family cysteine cluster protein [Candidatus Omnitrophota bacterium]